MRPRCPGRARDVRSMWLFGLEGEELVKASRCRRPLGHRGKCLQNPQAGLLPPWRTIDYNRYNWPVSA